MNRYSLLVNTCDKFEDCWDPFFKLMSIYWPDYKGNIYLNTEKKEYTFEGLNINSLKVAEKWPLKRRQTWSECLTEALNRIDEDIILYMQEDYFLKDKVKTDLIENFVDLMNSDDSIHCIHLTDQAVIPEGTKSKYEKLLPVKPIQRYRVSCQAALWKKNVLKSLLLPHEDAWQFEEYGSKRSVVQKHNFFVVDMNWIKLNQFEIIPYLFTGIVQGRWIKEVVPLFEKHEIKIDYSNRGFHVDRPRKTFKQKALRKLKKIPSEFKSKLNLLIINLSFKSS